MKNDNQLITHLWWLNRFLTSQFMYKSFPEVLENGLNDETIIELKSLLHHLNDTYTQPAIDANINKSYSPPVN